MSEPYQACALYQQLAEYLRDQMSRELAELRSSSIKVERARLDTLIHDWFFTPQSNLHGSSPRDVIRREELDEPNLLPPPSPDDDEIIREMHEMDELLGGETHWHVDDGGLSLLDEYDPEGQAEYFRKMAERAAVRQAKDELLGSPPEEDNDLPFSQN